MTSHCCGRGLQPAGSTVRYNDPNKHRLVAWLSPGSAHTVAVIPSAREAPPGSLSLAAFHSPELPSGDPLGDVHTPKLLLYLSWEQPGKNLLQPHLDMKNKYSGEKMRQHLLKAAPPQAAFVHPPWWSQRRAPSFPWPWLSGAADADER